MTEFNSWKHPKTGETRVYLNTLKRGIKIFAEKLNEDSYKVCGWYDDQIDIPQEYQNSGKCWAISMFMDELDAIGAPFSTSVSWDALVELSACETRKDLREFCKRN